MKTLIFLIGMIGQVEDKPDFSMLPPPPVVIIKQEIVEVPVYYMTDISGKEWYDRDKKLLTNHIKKVNKNIRDQEVKLSPEIEYYVGTDRYGRDWGSRTKDGLQQLLDKANAVATIQSWPRQYVPNITVAPQLQSWGSVSAGSSCAGGNCPR